MWNPQLCANPCAKMSSFSVGVGLVLSAPLRCHSSRKCTRSLQVRGRHLSLPEKSSTRAVCCDGPRTPSDEGDRTVSEPCDVHACGPGAPSLAVSGGQEGAGIVTVPACFRVADWPLRRCCRELFPAVFGSTKADRGDQTHLAPEEICCFHSGCSPSACSSLWVPSCGCPRSHAAAGAFHQAASRSRLQAGRPAHSGPHQIWRQA